MKGKLSHAPSIPLMNADDSSLGHCPNCGKYIPRGVLVQYEKNDDIEGFCAEWPACDNVVAPE